MPELHVVKDKLIKFKAVEVSYSEAGDFEIVQASFNSECDCPEMGELDYEWKACQQKKGPIYLVFLKSPNLSWVFPYARKLNIGHVVTFAILHNSHCPPPTGACHVVYESKKKMGFASRHRKTTAEQASSISPQKWSFVPLHLIMAEAYL